MAVAMSGRHTSRANRLLRLARMGLHLARGVAIAALAFPFTGEEGRRAHVQRWSRGMLDILAVSLRVTGKQPRFSEAPVMVVANHVSWLDILAIRAALPVRFVAKSEVRAWPVIGWLAERAGTFFIVRARPRDTARISKKLTQMLREGEPIAMFPEATTSDGSTVLKFHSSLLQPAVAAGATLRPVALRYARTDGTPCAEASYAGSRTFWESLSLIVTQPATFAELAFLAPIESSGRHRRELACAAREAILQSLFPPARGNRTETAGGPQAAAR
jgi:1-acyl-sn-glycerol-3-phosphate acyltransferase